MQTKAQERESLYQLRDVNLFGLLHKENVQIIEKEMPSSVTSMYVYIEEIPYIVLSSSLSSKDKKKEVFLQLEYHLQRGKNSTKLTPLNINMK